MKSLFLVSFFIVISAFSTNAQINSKFKRTLKKNNLELTVPEGFVEVTTLENKEMTYQFALKHGLDTFELRYTIYPLDDKIKEYKRNLKKPTQKLVHPNFYWETMYNEKIALISKVAVPQARAISEDAVKDEFNADAGAITFFSIHPTSVNSEYKYCLMMVIHKNFESDVYISFFGNDRDKIETLALKAFHAIRFKK